jgi:hypothetical protein
VRASPFFGTSRNQFSGRLKTKPQGKRTGEQNRPESPQETSGKKSSGFLCVLRIFVTERFGRFPAWNAGAARLSLPRIDDPRG